MSQPLPPAPPPTGARTVSPTGAPSLPSPVAPTSPATGGPLVSTAERVRRGLAPLVALLSSCLALLCLVNLADIVTQIDGLAVVNERLVGWAGVAGMASIAVAILALLAAPRLGVGLPLATGAAVAVFGLALGRSVIDDAQLALTLVILGLGAGGLLGGAAGMTVELPQRWRGATLTAFGLPLVAGPPVLSWVALHIPAGEDPRLALHPPVWPLAVVSALIVSWSALTLLLEPDRQRSAPGLAWDSAWTSLIVAASMPPVAVMLLGFAPDIRLLWLRPLIVVGSGLALVGLALVCRAVPTAPARVGYVAAGVVALCWPVCIGLLLVTADAGVTRVSALQVSIMAVAAGGGAVLAYWRPAAGVVAGLLLVAAAAAGAWVMPSEPWPMVAAAGPMAAGAGAALGGGLRCAARDITGGRFVGAVTLTTVVLGSLIAVPLSWALGGGVPGTEEAARAAGRVLLGLTFALAVLAAAYSSILLRQVRGSSEK